MNYLEKIYSIFEPVKIFQKFLKNESIQLSLVTSEIKIMVLCPTLHFKLLENRYRIYRMVPMVY
jgi:hypothetical protein